VNEIILSPNVTPTRHGRTIDTIIVHATAGSALWKTVCWFLNPKAGACAHYVIGRDGRLIQMAREEHTAWHATVWTVNLHSIGIELDNLNDGKEPYPKAQLQRLGDLCVDLCRRYPIPPERILGHRDVYPRKTDPAGLDLEELRDYIRETVTEQDHE